MGIANYGYDWPAKSKKDPHPVAQAVTFQQGVITAVESESDIISIPTLSIPIIPTKTRRIRSTPSGCWMASPPTTNCAPPSAPECEAPPCGAWAWKIPRSGTSGTPRIPDDAIRAKLEEVPPGYDLILEGDGDIWRITATPQSGQRTFDYDADQRRLRRRNVSKLSAFLAHPADGRGPAKSSAHLRRRTRRGVDAANSEHPRREKGSGGIFRDRRNGQSVSASS